MVQPADWPIGLSIHLNAWDAGKVDLEAWKNAGVSRVELAWRNDSFDMFDAANQEKCAGWVGDIVSCGMQVWTMHLPYGPLFDPSMDVDEVIARHIELMDLAQRLRIRTAVLHPSWEPIADEERSERLAVCKRSLVKLAEEAEQRGITIAVECLPRTCLGNTGVEMMELVSADARLGICCDVNHLVQEPPERFIRELGSRIVTLHISDNDGVDECHWMPGKGVIRWNEVIDALVEQRYAGPFLFEVRGATPPELEACWKSLLR